MTLLIAGFGDLGIAIAQQAAHSPVWQGTPIVAIKRSQLANIDLSNVSVLNTDLSDRESLRMALDSLETLTDVVYCAAPSERTEFAYRATYLTSLKNLVDILRTKASAAHLPRLLFVSSTAVYDSQAQGEFDEASPTKPRGFNGKVLLESETWLTENWPHASVLRLSGLYGPTKQRLLSSIVQGTTHAPESDQYIANRIHLDDAARAVLHLLHGDHVGTYIGTDSKPMSLRTLYQTLAKMLNAEPPSEGAPSAMMGKKCLSNQKLLSTGFKLQWPDCLAGYQAIIEQTRAQEM